MKKAVFFILDDSDSSEFIKTVLNKALQGGFKYSIGKITNNNQFPFFIGFYDNGSCELINRLLYQEEMPLLISSSDNYEKVFNYIDTFLTINPKKKWKDWLIETGAEYLNKLRMLGSAGKLSNKKYPPPSNSPSTVFMKNC